jgi:putative phosphoesterase
MPEIAVLSDTHVPSRAPEIPGWVRARIRDADHAIHAGDFDSADAYDRVHESADGALTAVAGNTDPPELGVPEVATVELGGVRFVVTHGDGRGSYAERVAWTTRENDGDVGISGHTHSISDRTRGSVRLLNPGSATGAPPVGGASMMVATAEDGEIEVTVERR